MNIAFIIPNLKKGGAENALSRITNYLHTEGCNITIILFYKGDLEYPVNSKVINMQLQPGRNIISKFLVMAQRIMKLKKIKKQNNYDAAISFLPNAHITNLLSRSNEKVILSIRNHLSSSFKNKLGKFYHFLVKKFYKKADKIITVSEAIKQDLIEKFKIPSEKIDIINNGYPVKEILKKSREKLTDAEKTIFNYDTIVTVGRLENQKGHKYLLEAFKIVNTFSSSKKLVIIGDGPLKNKLTRKVNNEGIKNVFFLGQVDNPFKYLRNSGLFVLSSIYEGFPNVICEALVTGLPIISTNCPSGPYEILAKNSSQNMYDKETGVIYTKYGVLVPVLMSSNENDDSNIKLLATEILNFNPDNYNSEELFELVNSKYSIEKIGLEWMKMINHTIEKLI